MSTRPALALAFLLALAAPAGAQRLPSDWDPARLQVTREELQDLLGRYEGLAASPEYSADFRRDAEAAAARIRTRLSEGDFQGGDRIVLRVRGLALPSDTVMVSAGPSLLLPDMGAISLEGVLRAELEDHLETALSRYMREPVVEARAMIRMAVQGAVTRPGFYVVPADMPLGSVLMTAGGAAREANLEDIEILRAGKTVLGGAELNQAIAQGRTLDQLNLRAGDQLNVGQRSPSRWLEVGRYALIIGSTVLLGVRIF